MPGVNYMVHSGLFNLFELDAFVGSRDDYVMHAVVSHERFMLAFRL